MLVGVNVDVGAIAIHAMPTQTHPLTLVVEKAVNVVIAANWFHAAVEHAMAVIAGTDQTRFHPESPGQSIIGGLIATFGAAILY